MALDLLKALSKAHGIDDTGVESTGSINCLIDQKHHVELSLDEEYILIKSPILQLSDDPKRRLEQQSVVLTVALGLIRVTRATPFIASSEAIKEPEVQPSPGSVGVNGSAAEELNAPELSRQMLLYRRMQAKGMKLFQLEQEVESFLSALDVYNAQLIAKGHLKAG